MARMNGSAITPVPRRIFFVCAISVAMKIRGEEIDHRADDDRVIAADRLGQVGVGVDVDLEAALTQEPDAGLRDLFADEDLAQTGVCSAQASRARVTATPRSISAPASVRTSSTAASAEVMSKMSNQPMWPMRKIFPFRSP